MADCLKEACSRSQAFESDFCRQHSDKITVAKHDTWLKEQAKIKKVAAIPTLLQAFDEDKYFGKFFSPKDSWKNWRIFLKVISGEKLDSDEAELAFQCTGQKTFPESGFDEFYGVVGRRGGKSRIMSFIAAYEAAYGGWHEYLAEGEIAQIFVIANDKKQAGIVFRYIKALLTAKYPGEILSETGGSLLLDNNVEILVQAATFRGIRGFSTACIILDELAFFRDEYSANPADEIVNALLPSLLEHGKLIGISTPYAKFGYFYDMHEEYYGKGDEDVLIWKAPTLVMNPSYSKLRMNRAIKKDPIAAKAEFEATFREDLETYLSIEEIKSVTNADISVLPPQPDIRYVAFTDPSGGKSDSFTLGIAHQDEGKIVVDRLEEVVAPYNPKEVTELFCSILKLYKVSSVTGDRFAGNWCSGAFRENGIYYKESKLNKNELYLDFQALVKMYKVLLLDNDKCSMQLQRLERRTRSGGVDVVDHPPGLHDDIANATAGVCTLLGLKPTATPEAAEARLPRMGKREERATFKKAVGEIEKEFAKEVGGKKILKPGDLGYIDRMPKKIKKRKKLFPVGDFNKEYGKEEDDQENN